MNKFEVANSIENNILSLNGSISRLKSILNQTVDPILKRELEEEIKELIAQRNSWKAMVAKVLEKPKYQEEQEQSSLNK